jgi:hypothetical protein
MVTCTAFDQKPCNLGTVAGLFARLMKKRRPADCIEFVIVAGSVRIAARIE